MFDFLIAGSEYETVNSLMSDPNCQFSDPFFAAAEKIRLIEPNETTQPTACASHRRTKVHTSGFPFFHRDGDVEKSQ